jgi:hypothetical protein
MFKKGSLDLVSLLAVALAVLLAAPALAGGGSPNSKHSKSNGVSFSYTATGSFQPASFAFADGTMGDSITLRGKSNFGPITVQEWASGAANQTGTPCTVPNVSAADAPGLQFPFSDSNEIITVVKTGDVLVQNLVRGTNCVSNTPSLPAPFAGTLHVVNVGGTGKFAHATGDETLHFQGVYEWCNATQCWGYVTHDESAASDD